MDVDASNRTTTESTDRTPRRARSRRPTPEAAIAGRFSSGSPPIPRRAGRCNCSICTKVAQTGGIVKPEAFQLISSEEALSSYEWGGRTAQRFFCKTCGIQCFARGSLPELGGAYVSVNYNCLDGVEVGEVKVIYWDGRHNNWDAGPRDQPWNILDGAGA